jgi:ABC-type Fe3+-hydroxamate transport system substrate-binding protein
LNTLKHIDQLGREIEIPEHPGRIVSLVPSQTELLHDLGLGDRVVGITKFCTHPSEWYRQKTRVGGTKKLNYKKIVDLDPDLILANKEENQKEDVEWLRERFPVWVSNVHDVPSAIEMIEQIGIITGKNESALQIGSEIESRFDSLRNYHKEKRVIYLIWNSPYMAAGKGTFIDSIMAHAGWKNVVMEERYPELDVQKMLQLQPDHILLSSEPFPFGTKHLEEIQNIFLRTESKNSPKIMLVDGRIFSWYGSALLETPKYIKRLMD